MNAQIDDEYGQIRLKRAWEGGRRLQEPIWEYRATVPAAVHAVSTVMDAVLEVGERTECFKGKELEIETALREALANAVIHGGKYGDRQSVQVSVCCYRNHEVEMVVRDSGCGFDLKSVPDPTITNRLDALATIVSPRGLPPPSSAAAERPRNTRIVKILLP